MNNGGVNWRQAAGEALLILLGVGLALLGQAWWEYRVEREVERHLIEGVIRDLRMDSADIRGATLSAQSRAAAADHLLRLADDPQVNSLREISTSPALQRPGVPNLQAEVLDRVRSAIPAHTLTAADALGRLGSIQRLDLADNTYREATASGQLDVIRDVDLRAAIGRYYFDAGRLGITNDDRMDANAQALRTRLADSGLSPEAPTADEEILEAIQASSALRAELHNVRGLALRQIRLWALIRYDGQQLSSRLRGWLNAH